MKVILVASVTADGFIAQSKEQSSLAWTSREDTRFFVQKTKEIGVVIMGATTFETIQPKHLPFSGRTVIVLSRSKTYSQYDPKDVRAESGTIQEVLEKLEKQNVTQVVLAGGSSVYTQFMQAGLVDELFLTVEPIVFGSGVKLFSDEALTKLHLSEVLDLSDQTKVFHYKVVKSE